MTTSPTLREKEPAAPPARARRIWRVLARDLGVVLLLLIGLEVTLRFVAPEYRRHLFDEDYTGGLPIERSAEGFRGPVPRAEKAPGELRVMSVGDSVTMGTGVPARSTFAHALGPALARETSLPVTTINAGVEGWGLAELRVAFEGRWRDVRPDVVVVGISGNLVSRAWIDRDKTVTPEQLVVIPSTEGDPGPATRLRRAVKTLCVPAFLSQGVQRPLYAIGLLDHNVDPAAPYGAMLAHGWRQIGLDPAVAESAWGLFERDLGALCASARARGARVVVTAVPTRFTLSDRAWDNEKSVPRGRITMDPCDRVAKACASLGVPYVDAREALRAERARSPDSPLYIQFDYTHLDERAHEVVAEALARHVAEHR